MEVWSRDIHVIESDSDKSDTQSTDSQMDDLVVNNPPAKNTSKFIQSSQIFLKLV